jgi:hypothetical protein
MPDAKKNKELVLGKMSSLDQRSPVSKKSIYYRALNKTEKLDFENASGVEGIDDEITILRLKIMAILENDPENIKLIMAASDILAKLVKVRYSMNHKGEGRFKEALENVFKNIVVPLGIKVINREL